MITLFITLTAVEAESAFGNQLRFFKTPVVCPMGYESADLVPPVQQPAGLPPLAQQPADVLPDGQRPDLPEPPHGSQPQENAQTRAGNLPAVDAARANEGLANDEIIFEMAARIVKGLVQGEEEVLPALAASFLKEKLVAQAQADISGVLVRHRFGPVRTLESGGFE
ncbi:hypothetical protein FOZ62_022497 [Perkinsus olseni]|uniref:Uncharacterized protein n=1 Tax=Perkinsus olseni TaxID=32597 RepID=A0A7J6S3Z8_PEROL|nr:hypothetical protein FOZ62_022497 [Perkinsus olseni]